ncbi:hypothetical protein TIFTF001_033781 [Ficus carica]|uniref:Uncharacterized protein n=1 Tax=Ficus carica TaxID=3494 RepID=A0AA88DZ83_FICCA|nr:hypothetical protein TIFTF001_033781 [Ficus carica]
MVELARDRPVYTADYYTSAVTLRYLTALRREFSIPDDVDIVVPGPNDLPSRPPSGHIALSAEYFRAGLRLPFHPFLRRSLTSLNISPAQLNANAYRDEDGSLVQGVLLLPGLQGDVHHKVSGLRQAVQAPVVLRRWPVAARTPLLLRTSPVGKSPRSVQERLRVDSSTTRPGVDFGEDRGAPGAIRP